MVLVAHMRKAMLPRCAPPFSLLQQAPRAGLAWSIIRPRVQVPELARLCHWLLGGACRTLVAKCRAVSLRLMLPRWARLRPVATDHSPSISVVMRVAPPLLRRNVLLTSRLAWWRNVPAWSIAHVSRWRLPEELFLKLPSWSKLRRRMASIADSNVSPLTPLSRWQSLSRLALATFRLRVVDEVSLLGWHHRGCRLSTSLARSLWLQRMFRTASLLLRALPRLLLRLLLSLAH